jgi:predicted  nucleic acid-binding Zn-ribbon protein
MVELADLDKQIQSQTESLIQKARDEAAQKAREETMREVELQRKAEEAQRDKEAMERRVAEVEKKASEEVSKLKEQVNSLISSKAVVQGDNPFGTTKDLSRQDVDVIEERSAKAFFGPQYNEMFR